MALVREKWLGLGVGNGTAKVPGEQEVRYLKVYRVM